MQRPRGLSGRFSKVVALTLFLVLTALAQQQPEAVAGQAAAPAQAEEKSASTPVASAKATMYVYRLRSHRGMFAKPSIYIDERELARIENGRFFVVTVDPGTHVVRSVDKASTVTVEMQPSQVYFLRLAVQQTQFTFRFETTLVPPEQGWSEIGQTEPNDSKDIKDNELAAVGPRPSKPATAPSEPSTPGGSSAGTCRTVAVTRSSFVAVLGRVELGHKQSPDGYKVVDVVNYPGAYVGKWYEVNELPAVQNKDGVHVLLLAKGYTPEDLAKAHLFCQSGEGSAADARLQADIGKTIRVLEAADHPSCDFQIVNQLHSADKLGMERWDVKSCDATSSYDVQIVPSPKGGADFRVVKSVPEQKADTAAPAPVSSPAADAHTSSEELVPYEGQKSEFTIAIPNGWVAQDQSQTLGKGNSRFNLIIFHQSYTTLTGQDAKAVELMAMKQLTGIDSGEIPSFFVQRIPAKNGISCAGFSEKAEKDVFKMITNDPILGKGAAIQEAPRSEPVTVAGCKGIRVHGSGQPPKENVLQTLDVYAASDGKVLYLFTLRNHADYYKKNVEVFQKSMATAKLAAAQ